MGHQRYTPKYGVSGCHGWSSRLKTVCTHCNKWFQVNDRALGKRAKCKACGGVFVVRPETMDEVAMKEVAPPPSMGSTTGMRPVRKANTPTVKNDPLDALANAANNSQHDHADHNQRRARERESFHSLKEHGEMGKLAPGAQASMVLGIVGVVLAPAVIGAVFAIFAITFGNGARKRIRRSRGVLDGKGAATAGMIMGWCALLILGIIACIVLIMLIRHGPFVTQTEIRTK